jgi:hypothetical protein
MTGSSYVMKNIDAPVYKHIGRSTIIIINDRDLVFQRLSKHNNCKYHIKINKIIRKWDNILYTIELLNPKDN